MILANDDERKGVQKLLDFVNKDIKYNQGLVDNRKKMDLSVDEYLEAFTKLNFLINMKEYIKWQMAMFNKEV